MAAVNATEAVDIRLSDAERAILRAGLAEWGGPAHCTEEFAVAMGFRSVEDLHEQVPRLTAAVAAGEPMTGRDWARTLLAAELAFISDFIGSGVEWATTTGFSDVDTIAVIRGIQRKAAVRAIWQRTP